jgi:hypothetical protein
LPLDCVECDAHLPCVRTIYKIGKGRGKCGVSSVMGDQRREEGTMLGGEIFVAPLGIREIRARCALVR